jgi:hypothetical protein
MKTRNSQYKSFTVHLSRAAAIKLVELAARTYRSQTQIINLLLLNAGEDDLRVPAAPEPAAQSVPQEDADEQAKQ